MTRRAVWPSLALAALFWIGPAAAKGKKTSEAAAKADCDKVLSRLLEFAEKMLREQGGFLPFAGGLNKEGKVVMLAAFDRDAKKPQDAEQLVGLLKTGLKDGAHSGQYKATGLLIDGRVVPPGQTEKSDSIIALLDHASGYSIQLFVPFHFDEKRQPVFAQSFAMKTRNEIFPAK